LKKNLVENKYIADVDFEAIATECRRKAYIYIVCESKVVYQKVRRELAALLSYRRGIFYHGGIVVVGVKYKKSFLPYFDKVIMLWRKKSR
jgi:hypothetical protein